MTFIEAYLPTLIAGFAVLALIALVVWRMIVNKKRGAHCGGCGSHCGNCHHAEKDGHA